MDRQDPPWNAPEAEMLAGWLDFHRATLALKCEGLDATQLCERSAPPSTLTLIGLVRHMAEVERSWFSCLIAGEDAPPLYYSDADPDGDFDNVSPDTVDEGFASWHAACEYSRQVMAGVGLDDLRHHDRRGIDISVRWVVVHMIEEYARHNGHADLLRQRIDGATGE